MCEERENNINQRVTDKEEKKMETKTITKKQLEFAAKNITTALQLEQGIVTGPKITKADLIKQITKHKRKLKEVKNLDPRTVEILSAIGIPKTTKPKESKKYTRAQAFCDALKGKAKTVGEIAQKAMDSYMTANPKKKQPQQASVEWAVRDYLQPLVILGFVEVKDKKYSLTK